MFVIIMKNASGEIDRREVESPVDAVEAVSEMVLCAGELFPGDVIEIFEKEV